MPRDINQASARRIECQARILELLEQEPMSNHDLAKVLDMSRSGVLNYTAALRESRLIHVAEWRRTYAGGPPRACFGLGDKPDAVFVPVKPVPDPARHPNLLGDQNRKAIVLALATPRTSEEIAAHCGLSDSTVTRYIAALRGEKKARITSWRRASNGKAWVPVYVLGHADDTPRPPGQVRPLAQPKRIDKRDRSVDTASASRAIVQKTIEAAREKPHGFFAALGV